MAGRKPIKSPVLSLKQCSVECFCVPREWTVSIYSSGGISLRLPTLFEGRSSLIKLAMNIFQEFAGTGRRGLTDRAEDHLQLNTVTIWELRLPLHSTFSIYERQTNGYIMVDVIDIRPVALTFPGPCFRYPLQTRSSCVSMSSPTFTLHSLLTINQKLPIEDICVGENIVFYCQQPVFHICLEFTSHPAGILDQHT